ncbi:YARHG domain-containing protein [uncultured Treponema sp.]|uniref:YARHG domain-containing protein n=1 Tax=uncultured Treponema sp. TaxID=162155 RepID=UPI00259A3018|nr:YARHG domain-containing protein [uncultured Treponema sp.]
MSDSDFYRLLLNYERWEELLGFRTSGQDKSRYIFKIIDMLPYKFPAFEFILFKGRQGIKVYEFNYETDENQWCFYYYDRIQQKYVQDENATSEELEQIHGSPDFFAEAGIDYAKLERPLVPSDLEGFSKAALRIWRNAVYARHGRTFKSEDLQALFNEYAWYKPDNDYSNAKLSETDKANIKLIQEFEKK